jgi:hypothetical protein
VKRQSFSTCHLAEETSLGIETTQPRERATCPISTSLERTKKSASSVHLAVCARDDDLVCNRLRAVVYGSDYIMLTAILAALAYTPASCALSRSTAARVKSLAMSKTIMNARDHADVPSLHRTSVCRFAELHHWITQEGPRVATVSCTSTAAMLLHKVTNITGLLRKDQEW